ncbi:MAG: hypothetical protein IPK79_07615 [Vampirovibrionales bacterium]|nr:hypothetical protein [Vampirovibrionales bacterium]
MGSPGNPLNLGGMLQQMGQAMIQRLTPAPTPTAGALPPPAGMPASAPAGNFISTDALFRQLQTLQTELSPMQQGQLLRGLLGLPQDVRSALAMLADPQFAAKTAGLTTLADILALLPHAAVTPEAVSEFIGKNAPDGVGKLIKLIQSNPAAAMGGDSAKLTELMGLLSTLGARIQGPAAQPLTLLAQLYLPWCPLTLATRPEDAWPESDDGSQNESESGADASLTLYLQTCRLGKFKIGMAVRKHIQLSATVAHDPVATPHLEGILTLWREAMQKEGAPPPTITLLEQTLPQQPAETLPEVTKPAASVLAPSMGAPIAAFLGACALSRLILEADERLDMLKRRQDSH